MIKSLLESVEEENQRYNLGVPMWIADEHYRHIIEDDKNLFARKLDFNNSSKIKK